MTLEELYRLKQELLSHCVGMSYNMQKVFEINKIIEEKEECQKRLVKESNSKELEE
jgi:hypothetical protein